MSRHGDASAASAAAGAVEEPTIEREIDDYRAGHSNDVYELSKAVVAASALGAAHFRLYRDTLNDMLTALSLDPQAATYEKDDFTKGKDAPTIQKETWLLGRALLASGKMNDAYMANKLFPLMKSLLEDTSNPFLPWARAYTVAYLANPANADHYQKYFNTYYKTSGFTTYDQEDSGSPAEVIWERIFYIAASMSRPPVYNAMLAALIKELGQTTIEGAFNLMRYDKTDFPAWAVSYMANVAAEAGDHRNATTMQSLLEQKLRDTQDEGDAMIARAYQLATKELLAEPDSTLGASDDSRELGGSSLT